MPRVRGAAGKVRRAMVFYQRTSIFFRQIVQFVGYRGGR